MNKIYKEMYPNKLFTLSEANKIIKDYQICKNNINKLVKQRYITRLKAGMYYINPLDNKEFYPDIIHIASKIRHDATISSNTALNILLKDQANKTSQNESKPPLTELKFTFNEPIVYLSSKYASKIRITKHTYKILKGQNFGIDKMPYQTNYATFEIKITDMERTIIDCVRTRSIKAEELINILKTRRIEINFRKIINYLEKYDMPILYNKIGMILEQCKINLKLSDSDIDKIKKKLGKKIYYYKERGIKLIRPRYKYYKEWNIMIPEQLYESVKIVKQPTTP